ncbi:MAG: anthranilate synthase component I family protein [Actinomycetota bacterium]
MFVFGPDEFLKYAKPGKAVPLVEEIPPNSLTPREAYRRLAARPDSFLLESAGGSPVISEYSMVGGDPIHVISTKGKDPFPELRAAVNRFSPGSLPIDLPFWGGAVGFLSYDVARYIERIPVLTDDDLKLPETTFIFPGVCLVFAHLTGKKYLIVNEVCGRNPRLSLKKATARLEEARSRLAEEPTPAETCRPENNEVPVVSANMDNRSYERIVNRAKKYIFAGDIFQANLSVRFQVPAPADSFSLYDRLLKINPSPFSSYLDFGNWQLVSSSPERLVKLRDGLVETRPIAGTRRRGRDESEDDDLTADLILNEKERAEHVMLVDLERNDIGRVCRYGTVKPTELFTIEKYSHVIHIVSNITGEMDEGKDQFDLIRAVFPGGTITGCPKVRCMEIIEELEPTRRGPYTGSIGYFGFSGNADFNIIIRTFTVNGGEAYVQAGAGIVADSDPAREYYESVSKAAALLEAAGVKREEVKWETLPTSTAS